MMSFEQIKAKVPNANHPPKEDCKYCKGEGFKDDSPCICLFVDHHLCEEVGSMLGEYARDMKKKLQSDHFNEVYDKMVSYGINKFRK